MLGAGAARFEHSGNVDQRLAGLGDKIVGLKFLSGIPADLAAYEEQGAARQDAVGITLGLIAVGLLLFCDLGVSDVV